MVVEGSWHVINPHELDKISLSIIIYIFFNQMILDEKMAQKKNHAPLKKNRGLSSQKDHSFITYHHITSFHSLLLALFLHTFIINLPSHNLYSSSSPSLTPPPTNLHQTNGTINPPHQNQHQTNNNNNNTPSTVTFFLVSASLFLQPPYCHFHAKHELRFESPPCYDFLLCVLTSYCCC